MHCRLYWLALALIVAVELAGPVFSRSQGAFRGLVRRITVQTLDKVTHNVCRNDVELAAAVVNPEVIVAVISDDIAVSNAAWVQFYDTPVTLLRPLTILGQYEDPSRWPVLDLSNASALIRLAPGGSLNFSRVIIANWRNNAPYFQAPGMDLIAKALNSTPTTGDSAGLAPSTGGTGQISPTPNATALSAAASTPALFVCNAVLVHRICMPYPTFEGYMTGLSRPPELPPGNQRTLLLQPQQYSEIAGGSGSSSGGAKSIIGDSNNSSSAGCDGESYTCYAARFLNVDVGLYATDLNPYGRTERAGYISWLHGVESRCVKVMTDDCLAKGGGPVGCYWRMVVNMPAAASAATGVVHHSSGRLLVPLLIGLLGGAALFVTLLVAAVLWRRRHRRLIKRQQPRPKADTAAGKHSAAAAAGKQGAAGCTSDIESNSTDMSGSCVAAAAAAAADSALITFNQQQVLLVLNEKQPGNVGASVAAAAAPMAAPLVATAAPAPVAEVNGTTTADMSFVEDESSGNRAGPPQPLLLRCLELEVALTPVTPLTPLRPGLTVEGAVMAAEVKLLPVTLGKGAFGRVVEGRYFGERVAVKLLNTGLLASAALVAGNVGAEAKGVTAGIMVVEKMVELSKAGARGADGQAPAAAAGTSWEEAVASAPAAARDDAATKTEVEVRAEAETTVGAALGAAMKAAVQSTVRATPGTAAVIPGAATPGTAAAALGSATPGEAAAGVAAPPLSGCQQGSPQVPPVLNVRALKALQQEVEVLARCQHPNIVRLLAASLDPPRVCLVMELMDTSLDRLLHGKGQHRRTLQLSTVLHIGIQIARSLAYLHPTILHRDLKPANVLIYQPDSDKPLAKLADFGLSRLRETVLVTQNPEVGTVPYMAPEAFDISNNTITDRADIYALGVLLWEMLAGRRPWTGYTTVQVGYILVALNERLPLHDLPYERCPPKLRALIQACWEADPARRPAAAEVVKTLMLVQEALLLPWQVQQPRWAADTGGGGQPRAKHP